MKFIEFLITILSTIKAYSYRGEFRVDIFLPPCLQSISPPPKRSPTTLSTLLKSTLTHLTNHPSLPPNPFATPALSTFSTATSLTAHPRLGSSSLSATTLRNPRLNGSSASLARTFRATAFARPWFRCAGSTWSVEREPSEERKVQDINWGMVLGSWS